MEGHRIMLDTCSYGNLAKDPEVAEFSAILKQKNFMVCGSAAIRKELRKIHPKTSLGKAKLRMLTLALYDSFVNQKRHYSLTPLIEELSAKYALEYKGNKPISELLADFQIVATATIHRVGIIVTDDFSTMASPEAIAAYSKVNSPQELETPAFANLEGFKRTARQ